MKEIPLLKLAAELFSPNPNILVGPGDDCAVVNVDSTNEALMLLALDQVNPDVHYVDKQTTPQKIAAKLLKRNLSDIAAMGGKPAYALTSLSFSKNKNQKFCVELMKALAECADSFNVAICGGDISKSLYADCFSLTIVGFVNKYKLSLRTGAQDGDLLFATGVFGKSFETDHHLDFIPRLRESSFIAGDFSNTMIDVSDGLLLDARRIALHSEIGLKLFCDKIPLRTSDTSLENALTDGEDYELLFAVPKEKAEDLQKNWPFSTHLSIIGEFLDEIPSGTLIDDSEKLLLNSDFCTYEIAGYEHLSSDF
jgi:thiamine-monophosphate kinase